MYIVLSFLVLEDPIVYICILRIVVLLFSKENPLNFRRRYRHRCEIVVPYLKNSELANDGKTAGLDKNYDVSCFVCYRSNILVVAVVGQLFFVRKTKYYSLTKIERQYFLYDVLLI